MEQRFERTDRAWTTSLGRDADAKVDIYYKSEALRGIWLADSTSDIRSVQEAPLCDTRSFTFHLQCYDVAPVIRLKWGIVN